jgi:hypothetical protein
LPLRADRIGYGSSMNRPTARRTIGIMKYMVGAAIAQEIIQDVIQLRTITVSQPRTRQVATPDTRKVMKKLVPIARTGW